MGPIIGVVGAVILLLITLTGISRCQINDLKESLTLCREAREAIADTADNNRIQFEACESRRQSLLDEIRITKKAEQIASREVQELEEANEELAEKERKLREELYNDQNCSEVTDLYLCSDVADSLRRQARGNEDGDS